MSDIPVIDFADTGLHSKDATKVSTQVLRDLGVKLKRYFSSGGFCYLKNHGVDEKLLSDYLRVSREFFEKPAEVKQKYAVGSDIKHGWIGFDQQTLNPDRPTDLKELFSYSPFLHMTTWPSVDNFESLTKQMHDACTALTYRFLDILSYSLDLPEEFMRNAHTSIGLSGNTSAIKSLYYPPIQPDHKVKAGRIRLGEHDDYGSLTFLFQDDIGGLEMKASGGEFIPATPIPGTVLVIVGALLQRWTSDAFVAVKHRVLIPEEELQRKSCRQSIVFFVEPDDDFVVKCLDGSDKYEPIRSIDYLDFRRRETFVVKS